jgi:hypothetical protein
MSWRVTDQPRPLGAGRVCADHNWSVKSISSPQHGAEQSAGAGSLEPGTTCHRRPPLCAQEPRCRTARGLAAAHRACCRLVDSGSASFAGGRVLARAHHGQNPQSGTPGNAARESRHTSTSDLPRKPGSGTRVAGSYMSPRVAGTRPVDPADRPPDPKVSPPLELPRNSDQSNLWTTHPAVSARGSGTLIRRHWRKRASA